MEIVANYYQDLFTLNNPENVEEVLAEIPQKVNDEINTTLTATFTITKCIFSNEF